MTKNDVLLVFKKGPIVLSLPCVKVIFPFPFHILIAFKECWAAWIPTDASTLFWNRFSGNVTDFADRKRNSRLEETR